jgi:hypothetical protein
MYGKARSRLNLGRGAASDQRAPPRHAHEMARIGYYYVELTPAMLSASSPAMDDERAPIADPGFRPERISALLK